MERTRPGRDRLDLSLWKIMSVVVIGSFMAQLDATLVNVSLSSLAQDFDASLGLIQWVTSGYLLALTLILPLNGWMVNRFGGKALYLGCFAAFTVTSGLCACAWSAPSLIAFRVLQGFSGGLLAPLAQMTLARAAGARMAEVLSIGALPVLLAPFLGPVIAGVIVQNASWRWLFLINLPVGGLALMLAALFLPNDRGERKPQRLDFIGLGLLSPGLVLFLYGGLHLDEGAGLAALLSAVIMLAVFAWRSVVKGAEALIDFRLFQNARFSASISTMFLSNGITFAGQMLIPIFLIRACGVSPGRTGWLMTPMGLAMMASFPLAGMLSRRIGIRRLAALGALLGLAASLPFLVLAQQGLNIPVLMGALFLRGVGLGAIAIPAVASGYATIARADLPMATTTMNIVQRLGGPALTTLVATTLTWGLSAGSSPVAVSYGFTLGFGVLCLMQAGLFVATLQLPQR